MSNAKKTFGKAVPQQSEVSKASESGRNFEEKIPKIFLKAMPLRDLSDISKITQEIKSGNIIILKVTPLATKSIVDIKKAVNKLCDFVKTINGDIARLGEERIVITPSDIQIWREKPILPEGQIPTAT